MNKKNTTVTQGNTEKVEQMVCSICGKTINRFDANNPQPFADGVCCHDCDSRYVVPFRVLLMKFGKLNPDLKTESIEIKLRF